MTTIDEELWTLTWTRCYSDVDAIAQALLGALNGRELEFRTRILVRDALDGLERIWGTDQLLSWAQKHRVQDAVSRARQADLGPTGFHSMETRLVKPTSGAAVRDYLRDLGHELRRPARIEIGGAVALILGEKLIAAPKELDIVDGLPAELQRSYDLLKVLTERHGLILTRFRSPHLPTGWRSRTWLLGRFGALEVAVVDAYDVLAGKLFSKRTKDFNDLRALKPQLDWQKLKARVATSTSGFRSDPSLLKAAERNWYVLTGEELPASKPA